MTNLEKYIFVKFAHGRHDLNLPAPEGHNQNFHEWKENQGATSPSEEEVEKGKSFIRQDYSHKENLRDFLKRRNAYSLVGGTDARINSALAAIRERLGMGRKVYMNKPVSEEYKFLETPGMRDRFPTYVLNRPGKKISPSQVKDTLNHLVQKRTPVSWHTDKEMNPFSELTNPGWFAGGMGAAGTYNSGKNLIRMNQERPGWPGAGNPFHRLYSNAFQPEPWQPRIDSTLLHELRHSQRRRTGLNYTPRHEITVPSWYDPNSTYQLPAGYGVGSAKTPTGQVAHADYAFTDVENDPRVIEEAQYRMEQPMDPEAYRPNDEGVDLDKDGVPDHATYAPDLSNPGSNIRKNPYDPNIGTEEATDWLNRDDLKQWELSQWKNQESEEGDYKPDPSSGETFESKGSYKKFVDSGWPQQWMKEGY